MEPKDPHSAKSIGERRTGAKVVQLPREWLGPTEELVPFGVSADAPPPPASDRPPSAQSFWTEDAASLHAALQGTPPPNEKTTPAPLRTRMRRMRPPRRRSRLNRRAVPVLTLGGIALGLLALTGSMFGSAHRPVPAHGQASSARLTAQTADIARNAADWRLLARVNKKSHGRLAAHLSKASSKPGRGGSPRHPSRHATREAAPSTGYRSVVSYHSAITVQPVTAAPPASQTPATPAAPINQPTISSARQVSSANTSASNPSPASLLGPGHCACG